MACMHNLFVKELWNVLAQPTCSYASWNDVLSGVLISGSEEPSFNIWGRTLREGVGYVTKCLRKQLNSKKNLQGNMVKGLFIIMGEGVNLSISTPHSIIT